MIKALAIVVCLPALPLQASQGEPLNLGSGMRGLVFTWIIPQDPAQPFDTVAFVCNMKPGYDLSGGFDAKNPDTRIILKETLAPDYLKQFDPRFWAGWVGCRIYSFAEDTAFSGPDLYRIEQGHIRIYPGQAQREARRIYGLGDHQRFLGAFDGRVFYWTLDKPQEVQFRSGVQVYRFKLDKRVTEPLGMSKGNPKGDLALFAVAKHAGWFHVSPRTMDWFIFNFKNAELIR